MHQYKAFGLIIESELKFEELMPVKEVVTQIRIMQGEIPKEIENATINTDTVKIASERYLMWVNQIGGFYVEKGNLILVEPMSGTSLEEIKLYILGSCMGALLYQRRILPLHGSCLNIKGNGVIITGESGAGKSTLAAALCKNGYKMLTDDVSAIVFDEEKNPSVIPAYPCQKLWEDAINQMNLEQKKKILNRIAQGQHKYSVFNQEYFEDNERKLSVVFELISYKNREVLIKEITGSQKLTVLLKNTYRRIVAEAMNLNEWHFIQCAQIASCIKSYQIFRPEQIHMEEEIANLMLEKIDEANS